MRIDAHQHFWTIAGPFRHGWLDVPAHAPIRRDFLPSDLKPVCALARIDGTIFIQTQHDPAENDWALALAAANPWIRGVVGWVDLTGPDPEDALRAARRNPKFVGVRHLVHDETDDGWLARPDVRRGFGALERLGVPFDLLLRPHHLPRVPALADAFPSLKLVIDHCAKPRIAKGPTPAWLDPLRACARRPNVFCKLSGLVTEADWTTWKPADLAPFVRAVVDAFGPRRLMFGSDWPVCLLASSYARWVEALDWCLRDLPAPDRDLIFGGTAVACYGLSIPSRTLGPSHDR
ncbi:MAG: amidohydrolase family protein [bacterium]